MKFLNVSFLGFGGILILGLLVAWSASMPKQANVNQIGGCKPCRGTRSIGCGSKTGYSSDCTYSFNYCIYDKKANRLCIPGGGGSPHNCLSDGDCYSFKNDLCS